MKNIAKYFVLSGLMLLLNSCQQLFAQVKIGDNPAVISKASLLELESTDKGLLLPRLQDTLLINALNPPDGMMIFVVGKDSTENLFVRKNKIWALVSTTANKLNTAVQKANYTASKGQLNFTTPAVITDTNKVCFYRNGVMIGFTVTGTNVITSEIVCDNGDEIKIIQFN